VHQSEIEAHAFAVVKRGHDPEEVRSYLRKVATSVKDAPGRSYGDVGERVASVFESAEKAATEINEVAEREAEQLAVAKMADADAHHDRVRSEADHYASTTRAEADRVCAELKDPAERDALQIRVRASDVESRVTAETERARAEVDEYVNHQTAAADRCVRKSKNAR